MQLDESDVAVGAQNIFAHSGLLVHRIHIAVLTVQEFVVFNVDHNYAVVFIFRKMRLSAVFFFTIFLTVLAVAASAHL